MGVPYAEVIGDPIAHSKSPLIHNFWLDKLGIEGSYCATRVAVAELPGYLGARRAAPDWRGCNVTMPHKRAIVPLLDDVATYGPAAVNCVVPKGGRLVGHDTDSGGIDEATRGAVDIDAPICIIGTGGAARGAIASLDVIAVFQFRIIARDGAQADQLLAPYGKYGRRFDFVHAGSALKGCAGVINATPLGMAGFQPMPDQILSGLAGIRPGGFALDLVYQPLETAFMAAARRVGLEAINGLTVLIGQASYAFFHFFNVPAPREHDDELRALLTQ